MKQIKSRWSTKLLLLAATVVLSSNALADRGKHGRHHYEDSAAVGGQIYAYGKVLKVSPIYRDVRVSTPRKECWKEPVTVTRHRGGDRGASTLAGALIGGVIGNQLGRGRGNKLATAMGTVIGAQMGHDANRGYTTESSTAYREVCQETERVNYEEVIDGYRVTYRYKGQRFHTRMPYDPGQKIKLKISVEPVF